MPSRGRSRPLPWWAVPRSPCSVGESDPARRRCARRPSGAAGPESLWASGVVPDRPAPGTSGAACARRGPSARGPGRCGHRLARVAGIDPQGRELREPRGDAVQHQRCAIAIRDIGRMDHGFEHQAPAIHQQMALATTQLLGSVIAARPPFSVVLADWLSRMAAVGWGWRPARCRTRSRSSSLSRSQVPSRSQARKYT